jgi:hypothetical protein
LTIFDLLTRLGPDLAPAERDGVKKVAWKLLEWPRDAELPDLRLKVAQDSQVRLRGWDLAQRVDAVEYAAA